MVTRYFRLSEDAYLPGRWELGTPRDSRAREFGSRVFLRAGPTHVECALRVPIEQSGTPLDVSFADIGTVPVVSERVATLLSQCAPDDVQLFPVGVETLSESYFIVNVVRLVKCIDDEASGEVRYWTEQDGLPAKVGQYSSVSGMRIDPSKVGDARIFRTWGWQVALIVSEDIKDALTLAGITGVRFTDVTGPSPHRQEEREREPRLLERRAQTDAARTEFWNTLGRLEEDSLLPMAVGGCWPAGRRALRVIHRSEGRILWVTDGLSDSFVDRAEPSVGFGLELALEADESFGDVEKSWPLQLLERVADEVAAHERVRERLRAGLLLSMEVSGNGLPDELLTPERRVGVLLGLKSSTLPRGFTLPAGEVGLIPLKVLQPTDIERLVTQGASGLDELLRRLGAGGAAGPLETRRM